MAIRHQKHTVGIGEYVDLIFWRRQKKNHVTHHLACHQYSNHLLVAMVRQGALNQRHYTFAQKANAIAKVQAYRACHGPGCSVVEACQKCGIKHINFIKWKKAGTMAEKQFKEKRGQRNKRKQNFFYNLDWITQVKMD